MFWILTVVWLGHGFGKDPRPAGESAAYQAALVGSANTLVESELELTAT